MMIKALCNRVGFHYNGILIILGGLLPVFKLESLLKFFKKFYFATNCGSWVSSSIFGPLSF